MISAIMDRHYSYKKIEADNLYKISVFDLNKAGLFSNDLNIGYAKWDKTLYKESFIVNERIDLRNSFKYINLKYHTLKENCDYKVPLVSTKCYFGGRRYWFLCPLVINGVSCNRRVGVLYKCGRYFGCRHCHRLTYKSRNFRGCELSLMGKYIDNSIEIERLKEEIVTIRYGSKYTRKYLRMLSLLEQNLRIAKVTGLLK